MKNIKDMTLEELESYKKQLETDKMWAGIGYGMYYDQKIGAVTYEINSRRRW